MRPLWKSLRIISKITNTTILKRKASQNQILSQNPMMIRSRSYLLSRIHILKMKIMIVLKIILSKTNQVLITVKNPLKSLIVNLFLIRMNLLIPMILKLKKQIKIILQ